MTTEHKPHSNPYLRAGDDEPAMIFYEDVQWVPEPTYDRVVKALQWEVGRLEEQLETAQGALRSILVQTTSTRIAATARAALEGVSSPASRQDA